MVLTLATVSLVAAAAYNVAVVTNVATVRVVSTDTALLALSPGAPTGTPATIENGMLTFDFASLQRNSVYTWTSLFTVRNNTANSVNVDIGTTGFAGLVVGFRTGATGSYVNPLPLLSLDANATMSVSVQVQVPSAFGASPIAQDVAGTIIVTGTR